MSRKLIVRLKGGLGNQLFCYATARRLALVNDVELVIDAVTGFKYDTLYCRTYALAPFHLPLRLATSAEQMEPFGRIRRLIARKSSGWKPLKYRSFIQQVGVKFEPGLLNLKLKYSTTYFDAFGQSEDYFKDIRDLLLQDLAMFPPSNDDAFALSKQINSGPSVAIHFRCFDSSDSDYSSNITLGYYAKALEQLLIKIGRAHLFVFSDKPEQAAIILAPLLIDQTFTIVRHACVESSAVTDFWLMRQCRHFVIGNSTFAWWAAWLREQSHQGTRIFAAAQNIDPDHSVTAWGFPGLLPERWTVL